MSIPPEVHERLIALERKVDRLFEHLGLAPEEASYDRDAEDEVEAEDMFRGYGPPADN